MTPDPLPSERASDPNAVLPVGICPECEGRGRVPNGAGLPLCNCPDCDGRGVYPTVPIDDEPDRRGGFRA